MHMKMLKSIPNWFKLSNYSGAANFSIEQWVVELDQRRAAFDLSSDPTEGGEARGIAGSIYSAIKRYGLYANMPRGDSSDSWDSWRSERDRIFIEHGGQRRTGAVRSSSIGEVLESIEILPNLQELINRNTQKSTPSVIRDSELHPKLCAELSIPIDDLIDGVLVNLPDDCSPGISTCRTINVELAASDEQLVREFSTWLKNERQRLGAEEAFRSFRSTDFVSWHEFGVLPYLDLTAVARFENYSIPMHVVADAIFPDEFGVDVVERVRKVTKEKAQLLFRESVIRQLKSQAKSE